VGDGRAVRRVRRRLVSDGVVAPAVIQISNATDEDYVVEFHLNNRAPGCRVLGVPDPSPLNAHHRLVLMGYEPGVSITIRPVLNPDLPRALLSTD
jgi:Fe2+ transport system protein FeoA